jgi:hypothetical protein
MRIRNRLIPICIVFFLLGCSSKPRGWWREGEIAVMADSTDWEAFQGVLRHTFEYVIRTPQPEKTFSLFHVSEKDFNRYSEFRYLLLVATLDSKGRISQIIQNVLTEPDVRDGVEEGRYFVFIQKNLWTKDQILVILIGKDVPTLRTQIENNYQMLYDIFDADFKKRLKKEMFERGEKKKLEKYLLDFYGWTLRIQHDYFLMDEFAEDGYLWLRRMYPERWIFIRWIEKGDTTLLNKNWVIEERNRIQRKYSEGERVSDHYLFVFRSEFLGRKAIIMTGLWEQQEKEFGGPFKNYTFYDSLSGRLYMIDLALFAPEYSSQKLPFLKRMDIMAHTFRTIYEPTEDD